MGLAELGPQREEHSSIYYYVRICLMSHFWLLLSLSLSHLYIIGGGPHICWRMALKNDHGRGVPFTRRHIRSDKSRQPSKDERRDRIWRCSLSFGKAAGLENEGGGSVFITTRRIHWSIGIFNFVFESWTSPWIIPNYLKSFHQYSIADIVSRRICCAALPPRVQNELCYKY